MPKAKTEPAADVFRRRLREEMKRQGVSQIEIARRSGTYPQNVARILSGQRGVTLPMAERLAAAVGIVIRFE
jgi:transcriptional regulator with XRE-family HTH domain